MIRFVSTLGSFLSKLGIRAQLFEIVREGENRERVGSALASGSAGLSVSEVSAKYREAVHQLEPWRSEDTVNSWFEQEQLVFGVFKDEQLIGRMCCNLALFDLSGQRRALDRDEAWLHSAVVDPRFRGQAVAQYMRASVYQLLRAMGRDRLYSATEYLNDPARRFKEKLGARVESKVFYLDLFGRWKRVWRFA